MRDRPPEAERPGPSEKFLRPQGRLISPRTLFPIGVALLLALLLGALSLRYSASARLTNLDLPTDGFQDTFLMNSKTSSGRCYVVNRRDSTLRRSDTTLPGRMQDCEKFGDHETNPTLEFWLVRSKRKGTSLYIPVEKVEDWTYPFLYNFVRDLTDSFELPRTAWTQLYVDRIYQGLYLRISLPYDKRKKDGRTEPLREILTVKGHSLTHLDTRFRTTSTLYADSVAAGVFPDIVPTPLMILWLSHHAPLEEAIFLMSNQEPYQLQPLPLPHSVEALYVEMNGHQLVATSDERYLRWKSSWSLKNDQNSHPFNEQQLHSLEVSFAVYAHRFLHALRVHAEFYRRTPQLEQQLARKQASIASLDLPRMVL